MQHPDQHRLVETFYRIEPRQFHLVKFILEGYDNLAVLSSLSGSSGLIRLRCAAESLTDLLRLLTQLAPRIKRSRLP
ncbi:MAG: DUF4911 domain-containing protein [Desulfofustis sp.]|nr:DUF4911 domain-containing protein [Desulfofustis sp.]